MNDVTTLALPPGHSRPYVVPTRTLVRRGSKPGAVATLHLEAVRDYLKKLEEKQEPEDFNRGLDHLHVSFEGGVMSARFLMHNGLSPDVLLVSENGASQLASQVLPGSFFSGLKQLAAMDQHGEKLSTAVWAKFGRLQEKPHLVRTVNMRLENKTYRVIRSCNGQTYAPYSNLEFVQALLDHADDIAEMPVLDWQVTDSAMRLRFCAIDNALAVLRHWDEGALMSEPVPMIECWNSEVGRRKVGLRGGMWKLICTNGMGHWDKKREWSWIHRGDPERIRSGVKHAYEDIMTTANGVVDAYNQALEVAIDDAFRWMELELRRERLPNRVLTQAQTNLSDPTTTPGGSLASVVDALTLTAQSEADLFQQADVEDVASRLLRRGLAQSLKTTDRTLITHK